MHSTSFYFQKLLFFPSSGIPVFDSKCKNSSFVARDTLEFNYYAGKSIDYKQFFNIINKKLVHKNFCCYVLETLCRMHIVCGIFIPKLITYF